MLSHPALFTTQVGGDTQREAFFAQQHVSAVTGVDRDNGVILREVADIPFAYYFPKRVNNPHLAEGQKWEVAVAEDFLLLYNCDFEKNKKYTIVLDVN